MCRFLVAILELSNQLLPSVLWCCWLGSGKGNRPVKNSVVGCWCGCLSWLWSKVQTCIWPSWCHSHSLSLASVKSRLVLPFWYRLNWVYPEKGPLNGCVCVRNRLSIVPNFTPPSLLPPQGQKSDKWKRWQMMISFTSILSSRSCKNSPSPGASTRDVELFAQTAARDKYSMRCPSTNSTLTNTHQLSSEIWRLQSLTATGHHERHVSGQSKWSNGWHTYQRQKQQQKSPTDAQKLQTWLNAADCLLTQSVATLQNKNNLTDAHRERKCADTIGTVLVPRAGHFQCWNINIFYK